VKKLGGKLIVSGFSQGCGMSLHCLYTTPDLVDAALGISGYLSFYIDISFLLLNTIQLLIKECQ